MATGSKILGALLVETEGVDPAQLEEALGPGREGSERVGETLVRLGAVEPEAVARVLALQLGITVAPVPLLPDEAALASVRPELARAHRLVPLRIDSRTIRLAMADPLNLAAIDDVQFQTGRRVEPLVATPAQIDVAIRRHYGGRAPAGDGELEQAIRQAPVVRLVDGILRRAIDDGASDIHVEETGRDVRVRLRVDGRLSQASDIPAALRRAVLSRIKVIAGMDISVRRRPQDGRLGFDHAGRRLTLRVSTLPVNGGEKAVVRVLDSESAPRDLGKLGMSPIDLVRVRRLLDKGEGVLLSAGPTGSGKSTTLFAALSELDRATQNVVTLEDPVEYRLPGVSQVQVDHRAGLGFAAALRAVLRQDPDVVMIGEIRDRETAEIAMAAAVTGHLVLSTIHTVDAPGAVTRLLHMGVPPFLVAGGLAGVVAQRLVRRICDRCHGGGCDRCSAGLRGRTGVYQVLAVTDPMRDEITRGASSARLRKLAREGGMGTLESDARRAVAAGLTMPHEISRLLQTGPAPARPCSRCEAAVPLGAVACPRCGLQRARSCRCGKALERGWRFCPWCVRPVAA